MVNAENPRPIVFINNTMETFTPTQSGALATYIWECARRMDDCGQVPWVITRTAPAPPFPWPRLLLLDPPRELPGRAGSAITRLQRRMLGWPRQRQRAWSSRVAGVLRAQGLDNAVLYLQNDVETASYLRAQFPSARIVHLFQNQLSAKPRFSKGLGRSVDVVAAVSDFTARWVESHYALPPSSVVTVHSGVDADTFAPREQAREAIPRVGYVGRTGIEKGADLLLQAAIQVAGVTKAFSVQIVGSNHWDGFELDDYQVHLQELRGQLTDLGVTVDFLGHIGRAELPQFMARTSIHVVPSRWDEPFGLTTLEGMASGNAIIGSRTGGTPEVVGNAGVLFERENVGELAELLRRLINDPAERAEAGRRARSRALEMTWDRTAAALLNMASDSS